MTAAKALCAGSWNPPRHTTYPSQSSDFRYRERELPPRQDRGLLPLAGEFCATATEIEIEFNCLESSRAFSGRTPANLFLCFFVFSRPSSGHFISKLLALLSFPAPDTSLSRILESQLPGIPDTSWSESLTADSYSIRKTGPSQISCQVFSVFQESALELLCTCDL